MMLAVKNYARMHASKNASKNAYFSKFSRAGMLPDPPLSPTHATSPPPPNINSSMKPCQGSQNRLERRWYKAIIYYC